MTAAKPTMNDNFAEVLGRVTTLEADVRSISAGQAEMKKAFDSVADEMRSGRKVNYSHWIGFAALLLSIVRLGGSGIINDVERNDSGVQAIRTELAERSEWMGAVGRTIEANHEELISRRGAVDSIDALKIQVVAIKEASDKKDLELAEKIEGLLERIRPQIDGLRDAQQATQAQTFDRFTRSNWEHEEAKIIGRLDALEARIP